MIEALHQWILHRFSNFTTERDFIEGDMWTMKYSFEILSRSFFFFKSHCCNSRKKSTFAVLIKRIKDLFYIKSLGLFNLCKERTLKIHQFQDVQNIFKSIYNVWKYQFFTWGNSDMRNRQRMTIRSLVVLSVLIFRLIRLLVLDTVLVELTWGKLINEYFPKKFTYLFPVPSSRLRGHREAAPHCCCHWGLSLGEYIGQIFKNYAQKCSYWVSESFTLA